MTIAGILVLMVLSFALHNMHSPKSHYEVSRGNMPLCTGQERDLLYINNIFLWCTFPKEFNPLLALVPYLAS